jgi:plastocyanin
MFMRFKGIAALFVLFLVLGVGLSARAQTDSGGGGTPSACASPVGSPVGSPAASPEIASTTAAGVPPISTPDASPQASPSADCGTPASGSTGGAAAGATSIELDAVDIAFNPTTLQIPANTDVTITFKNTGVLPHSFVSEELGIDTGQLPGGQETTVTVNAPAGSYQYICDVPGHADAGMVGTITAQ